MRAIFVEIAGEEPAMSFDAMQREAGDAEAAVHTVFDGQAAVGCEWREIDRQLRRIATRRAGLDAEEARWLVAARDAKVHVALGFATFVEYIERVLGYGPRVSIDRLRVAETLEALPTTRAALAAGEASYSAVRELTRVVTPETERAWLVATQGRTVREVEAMVSGHRRGDLPDDPIDPDLRPRILRLEVSPATYALFRDAERRLTVEAGHLLTDDELMAAMSEAVLIGVGPARSADATAAGEGATEGAATEAVAAPDERESSAAPRASARPHYQVALTVCSGCRRGWQVGAGGPIEVSAAVIETARCDAQEIGSVDDVVPTGASVAQPRASGSASRATSTIPPAVRRRVLRRDQGRCVVPGCRSARWVDLHHLVPRSQGGGHDPSNLVVLCAAHHRALHAGTLAITGTSGSLQVTHGDGRPWGAPPISSRTIW